MSLNIFGWGRRSRPETELLEAADQSWRVTRQPEPYTGSMRAYGLKVLLSPLTWAYHALRSFGQGYARSLIYYASSPRFKKKLAHPANEYLCA